MIPKVKYDFLAGETLLIDKPLEWTSFDVVNKIRYKLKHKLGVKKIKVGHSGTLDPLATGLLIICTGKHTKRITELQGLSKEYTGKIFLGGITPSYDRETEVSQVFPTDHITDAVIEEARKQFLGPIDQLPPMFSAIKVDGVPLYKKARRGEQVEVKPRAVEVFDFEITNIEMPELSFRVECSKGTYIRSLAFDYGKAVRSGAYLSELRRTKVGDFDVQNAWVLSDFIEYLDQSL